MTTDLPDEARAQLEEWMSLSDDLQYTDLRAPLMVSP